MLALTLYGAVSPIWTVIVILLGLIAGGIVTAPVARSWQYRVDRLEAMAASLEDRRPPAHMLASGDDAMARAERRLIVAAGAIVNEAEALGEQREEFDAILRSMSEAVVVTGRRGEVVLLNGAARRMFALDAETDYRGRDFVELCRDPRLQEFVAGCMRPAKEQAMSAELLIQNPAQRHLQVNASPVRASGGIAAAWVLVFHDVSQLKQYETARADFIANLTHELRTPLSALYGYSETLLAGVEDPETERRFLAIIERQARRLARLIDDLISLSHLERGLTPLKVEPLEPRRVLDESVELMREQARRQDLTLDTRCPPDLPAIAGDRDRLQQVMLNLLDNAIKYTPRGGCVTVEARAASLNGSEPAPGVELVITDTGEGIPPGDIPRLTERFYRVDRARSRELGGTGLGLAIVKHIVQLHQGRLKIESRLREGTKVTIWLPAATV
jgi:two-component system, OmpR family, phosphate regulon sensor histidine kinase PhoR